MILKDREVKQGRRFNGVEESGQFCYNTAMGYLFAAISAICYGLVPLFQSIAMTNGLSAESVVFFGYLFCLLFTYISCRIRKIRLVYTRNEIFQILIVSIFGYFATELLLNLAYERLPSGMVTVIHFTYPVIVCIVNCLFFKVRFSFWRLLAVVLSVFGLMCICRKDLASDILGLIFAIGSAFSFSFMVLYTDKSRLREIDDNRKLFIVYLVCIFSSLIAKVSLGTNETIDFSGFWPVALSGGLLLGGDLFLSLGIKRIGSTSAAFISVLEPITSMCATIAVCKVDFKVLTIVGSISIILSLLPNIIADRNEKEKE